jgi:hypothetical protein
LIHPQSAAALRNGAQGWGIERGQVDPHIWHWGNNTGYRAFVIASVRTGDGFVMLTNGENGLHHLESAC